MALSIRNEEAENLARQLARESGEDLTQALITALKDRLLRLRPRRDQQAPNLKAEIMAISRRCRSLPDLDSRTPDEILGYNSNGGLH